MKRIDRLMSEARLLRIHRAARAQGLFIAGPDFDWMGECGTAQIILNDVSNVGAKVGGKASGSAGSASATPVAAFENGDPAIDFSVLAPFMARALEVLQSLFEEMRPQEAVYAQLWPRIEGHFATCKEGRPDAVQLVEPDADVESVEQEVDQVEQEVDQGDDVDLLELHTGKPKRRVRPNNDPLAPRKAAARDVAMLAAESVLFDVVRRVIAGNDKARAVSAHSDGGGIVVEGGRVRRVRQPRVVKNADVRVRAALGGLPVPAAVKVATGRLSPIEEQKRREEKQRQRAAAAKRAEAGLPAEDAEAAEGGDIAELGAPGNGVSVRGVTVGAEPTEVAEGRDPAQVDRPDEGGALAGAPASGASAAGDPT